MVGRLDEEEPVERVKNPEDGTYPARQTGEQWTRSGWSVVGAPNSMRVVGKRSCPVQGGESAGPAGCTLEGEQPHERRRKASAARQAGSTENRKVRHNY